MDPHFEDWLLDTGYDPIAAKCRVSNLRRIEAAYGDLDELLERDRCRSVLTALSYTTADKRKSRPNPSRIDIDGDLYTGLSTLRSAIRKYLAFRQR